MVCSYCGTLAAMRTSCEPMKAANAVQDTASTNTATITEKVLPSRRRRSPRTSGATSKLNMIAKVIGTSTSRPKYNNASTVPVARILFARSRGVAGGSELGIAGPGVSIGGMLAPCTQFGQHRANEASVIRLTDRYAAHHR